MGTMILHVANWGYSYLQKQEQLQVKERKYELSWLLVLILSQIVNKSELLVWEQILCYNIGDWTKFLSTIRVKYFKKIDNFRNSSDSRNGKGSFLDGIGSVNKA